MVGLAPFEDDLARFVEGLRGRLGDALVSVVAYGSRVRGDAQPESDLDVFVVAEGLPRRALLRHDLVLPVLRALPEGFVETLSYVLFTPEEARHVRPFYLGMLSGHRVLHDRDGFFAAVLARLRRRLDELGSQRLVDEDGYEYWDLKPDWKPGDVVEL